MALGMFIRQCLHLSLSPPGLWPLVLWGPHLMGKDSCLNLALDM